MDCGNGDLEEELKGKVNVANGFVGLYQADEKSRSLGFGNQDIN